MLVKLTEVYGNSTATTNYLSNKKDRFVHLRLTLLRWLVVSVTVLLLSNAARADDHLVIGVENLLPHSGHVDIEGEGYANLVVQEIYSDLNVSFEFASYARLVRNLVNGKIDIMLISSPLNFTPEQGVIFPTQPVATSQLAFFVAADSEWNYTGDESAENVSLGLTSGLDYSPLKGFLDRTELNYYIEGEKHIARGLDLLMKNKINVFYEDKEAVLWTASRLNLKDKIRIAGFAIPEVGLFLAIGGHRADAKQLADTFDKQIVRLRQSGQLAKMIERAKASQ